NGFEVSLSGNSRNLKMSRNAMAQSGGPERNETARRQARANCQRVGVANLVFGNHLRQFVGGNGATFQNRFAFFALVHFRALNGPGPKKIAMLIGHPCGSEEAIERKR